jgi:hypothetical protein
MERSIGCQMVSRFAADLPDPGDDLGGMAYDNAVIALLYDR